MRTRKVLAIGFFAGAIIGGGVTFLEVAPATVAVLMKPLEWLTEGLHPYPRESLANLIIAFPLMFIYWGCVGALVALLLRVAFRVFLKPEQTGRDIPPPLGKPPGSHILR
jgi:hypothetical protein